MDCLNFNGTSSDSFQRQLSIKEPNFPEIKEFGTSADGCQSSCVISSSETLNMAYEAMEALRPETRRPANIRLFEVKTDGSPLLMALMAHPEKYGTAYGSGIGKDVGIGSFATVRKVQAAGVRILVALEEHEYEVISKRWHDAAVKEGFEVESHLFHTTDHTPLTYESMTKITTLARKAVANNVGIAIYCGKGFGRSGQAGAAVILSNMREVVSGKTEHLIDMNDEKTVVSHAVYSAVSALRERDPPAGGDLTLHNGRSSENGLTVETKEQIQALEIFYHSDCE